MDFFDEMMGSSEEGDLISGLEAVGALTPVGAELARKVASGQVTTAQLLQNRTQIAARMGRLPSPPFAMSERSTERRGPLGFTEDGSGANFFTLPAVIGATTTMRAKVSRVAHINRLLIVPTAPGVVVESIKIGDEEQTLASGCPVELYSTTALTDTLPDNFSPLGSGIDCIVTLKNTTAGVITGTIGTKATVKR
jgi:hypothetical protein